MIELHHKGHAKEKTFAQQYTLQKGLNKCGPHGKDAALTRTRQCKVKWFIVENQQGRECQETLLQVQQHHLKVSCSEE